MLVNILPLCCCVALWWMWLCCSVMDGSRGAQSCVWHGSTGETKAWNWITPHEKKKNSPVDVHLWLLNINRDQTIDVNAVRQWVMYFSSNKSNGNNKLYSGRPCRYLQAWLADSCSSLAKMCNVDDCVERQCFVAENLLYQILCSLYHLQFLWK